MKTSPSAAITPAPAPWHTLEVTEAARRLRADEHGLTSAEARKRIAEYGRNEIEGERVETVLAIVLRQVRDPLIYILIAAAGVSLTLRDFADAFLIAIVVVVNSVIGFVQEYRAREAMRSLERLAAPRATVLRDGSVSDIASADVVPGDVLLLTSGDRVSADARLIEVHDLAADESLLTGESDIVDKIADPLDDPALLAADQLNIVLAGTTIVRGRGRALVIRTGTTTELGRIAGAVKEVGQTSTPLQNEMRRFSARVGILIIGLAVIVLVIGLIRSMSAAEIFLTAVALAVATVPEGLPIVLTITLAVGVRRMARQHAIVRSLPAVETLGSTTVIGSDKTGTLTQNEMTVRAIVAGGARYEVSGVGYQPTGEITLDGIPAKIMEAPALLATLHTGVLASEVDPDTLGHERPIGDPTEIALLVAAKKGGIEPAGLHKTHLERDVLPFEPERRFMASLRESASGHVMHVKGAPEAVVGRCNRQLGRAGEEPIDGDAMLAEAARLGGRGLRVLAMAYQRTKERELGDETLADGFVLAGLVGMEDPLRPEAVLAVSAAREAGIRVLMLTGDHLDTARAIGKQLSLGEQAVAGHDLERMTNEELDRTLANVNVYARVAPEHKLRVVQRLKAHGEIVAVTGDGVNDAPALRAAHLGVAMGLRGSDVAREASDIVLADDNFATITKAVEQGRIVFANLRKVAFFLLSTASGEILAILVALFAGWPLPFTAGQILWINLVTDGLEDLALAFEPGEPRLISRPPRARNEGVLTGRLAARLGLVGALLAAATLGTFWWTLDATGDLTTARTVAVTQMVVMQFFHTFNCRSLTRSIFSIPLFSNRFLLVSLLAAGTAHGLALYAPPLQALLQFTPLSAVQLLVTVVLGSVVVLGGEFDKLLARRHLVREYA